MINKIKPSQSDAHTLNPQSSILNPFQDLKENVRSSIHSIQRRAKVFFLRLSRMGFRPMREEATRFLKRQESIVQFLKKRRLHRLPAYILLGPKSSGKTTLLLNSDTKFVFEKRVGSIDPIIPTSDVDWYVSRKSIYLDVGGFAAKPQKSLKRMQHLFYQFLKKHSRQVFLSGIVLVLSAHEVSECSIEEKKVYLQHLKEQLQEISVLFKRKLSLFVVINQCDAITGFQEFFKDLGKEERWQPWGISLSKTKGRKIRDQFAKEFDQLTAQLHQWLIWRLQHETNNEHRVLINHFPLQFSQLKPSLSHLVEEVVSDRLPLRGVFFTSAIQKVSFIRRELEPEAIPSSSHFLMQIQQPTNKGYFIHDFLNLFLLKHEFISRQKGFIERHQKMIRWVMSLFMGGVLIVASSFFVLDFKKQIQNFEKAQRAVAEYQMILQSRQTTELTFQEKLSALQSLQSIIASLSQRSIPLASIMGPQKKINELQIKASKTYGQMLQKLLIPMVMQDYVACLTSSTLSNEVLYKALKAYLMLEKSDRYQPSVFLSTLPKIWKAEAIEAQRTLFLPYLNDIFKYYPGSLSLDESAIETARKRLAQLTQPELSDLIFNDLVPSDKKLSLNLNQNQSVADVFTFRVPAIYISSQYTAQVTPELLNRLIAQAVQESVKGNAVLGPRPQLSSVDTATLEQDMRQRYYNEYAREWMDYLNNIKIADFSSLANLNRALLTLTNPQAPLLWQLFNLVNGNLNQGAASANIQLGEWMKVATRDDRYSLPAALNALKDLQVYVDKVLNADKTGSHIFDATVYRFRNHGFEDPVMNLREMAQNYPEPMRSWLYDLSVQTWHLMLSETQVYINQKWQEEVIPQYRAQLASRFPFSSVATNDASLESFSYFFAPTGLLDNFITKYIKPFMEVTQSTWKLKTQDGQSLALPNNVVSTLQSVYSIEHFFFTEKDMRLSAPFDLQLINFEDNVRGMSIQLGSQQFTYQKASEAHHFIWPEESSSSHSAKIILEDKHGRQTVLDAAGPWAWLRLLRQANVTKDPTTASLQVIFESEGLSAQMAMTLANPTRSFVPTELYDWHLPDQLFQRNP